MARKRKFDNWYSQLGDSALFIKYDLPTVAYGHERYFASVFFRYDNPYQDAIIAAFERLASGEN